MLLFFAVSGIIQTFGLHHPSPTLVTVSTAHTGRVLKDGFTLSSPILRWFIVFMAVGFVISTVLGVVMALTQGGHRKRALYCLAFGILFPLVVILISVFTR